MGTVVAADVSDAVLRELLAAHLKACEDELALEVAVEEAGRRLEGARSEFTRGASVDARRRLQEAASEERLAKVRLGGVQRRRLSTWVAYVRALLGR